MDGAEHCYSVLLVSASAKFNESLSALLPERSYHPITVAADVASARRLLLEGQYDIVLINTPLPDDLGVRLALDVCSRSGAGVLLLLTVLAFNLVGDGLRDAFDPKMKR